ncbi:MAG: hypothetical protein OXF02_02395 [Simkaniaceae bacterium]|nr:hypothetical protein [Simkaniaceae bacterium]
MLDLVLKAFCRPFAGDLSTDLLCKKVFDLDVSLRHKMRAQNHTKGCSLPLMDRVRAKALRCFCNKRSLDAVLPEHERKKYADLFRQFDRLIKGEVRNDREVFLALEKREGAHDTAIMNDFIRQERIRISPEEDMRGVSTEEREKLLAKAVGDRIMGRVAREMVQPSGDEKRPRKTVLLVPWSVKDPDGETHIAIFTMDWTVAQEPHPVCDYFDPKGKRSNRVPMEATLPLSVKGEEYELPVGKVLEHMREAVDKESGSLSEALQREMTCDDGFDDFESRKALIRMGKAVRDGTLMVGEDILCNNEEFGSLAQFARNEEDAPPSSRFEWVHERARNTAVARGTGATVETDGRTLSEQLSPCLHDITELEEGSSPEKTRLDELIGKRVATSYPEKEADLARVHDLEKAHRTTLKLMEIRKSLEESQQQYEDLDAEVKELDKRRQQCLEDRARSLADGMEDLGRTCHTRADILTELEKRGVPEYVQSPDTNALVDVRERMASAIEALHEERIAYEEPRLRYREVGEQLRQVEEDLKEVSGGREHLQRKLREADENLEKMQAHFDGVVAVIHSGALVPHTKNWQAARKEESYPKTSEQHEQSIREIEVVQHLLEKDEHGQLFSAILEEFRTDSGSGTPFRRSDESREQIRRAFLEPYRETVRYYDSLLSDPDTHNGCLLALNQAKTDLERRAEELTAACEGHEATTKKYREYTLKLAEYVVCGHGQGDKRSSIYPPFEEKRAALQGKQREIGELEKRFGKKKRLLEKLKEKRGRREVMYDRLETEVRELEECIVRDKRKIARKLAGREMLDHLNLSALEAAYPPSERNGNGSAYIEDAITPRRKNGPGQGVVGIAGVCVFDRTPLEHIARGHAYHVSSADEAKKIRDQAAEILTGRISASQEAKRQDDENKRVANERNPFVVSRRRSSPTPFRWHTSSETRLSGAKSARSASGGEYSAASYCYVKERQTGYNHGKALRRVGRRIREERSGEKKNTLRAEVIRDLILHSPPVSERVRR